MPATADEKDLIHKLEIQIAEINNSLRFIKWIGVFLATAAVGFLATSLGVAHRAGQIEASIDSLRRDTTLLRAEVKEDIAGLRAEVKEDIAGLRKDMTEESKAQSANTAKMLESLDHIQRTLAQRRADQSKSVQ